jgi:hypothetical protein
MATNGGLGPVAVRLEMTYQCMAGGPAEGVVMRWVSLRASAGSRPGDIHLYSQADASGQPSRWGPGSPALVGRARARFSHPMARFWALAPRAMAAISPFPPAGVEVRFQGFWGWDSEQHEQVELIRLTVAELAAPERVLLVVQGMKEPFALKPGPFILKGGDLTQASDTAPWATRRRHLAERFSETALELVEEF